MHRRLRIPRGLRRLLVLAALAMFASAQAMPPGYRYVGSRVVTGGRVVYWYWNPDTLERAIDGRSFVARMYARAIDVGQERPYAAEIRCDTRRYREYGAQGPYQAIEDGEPVAAVFRAGCDDGRVLSLAERSARLGMASEPAVASVTAAAPPAASAAAPAASSAVPAAGPSPRQDVASPSPASVAGAAPLAKVGTVPVPPDAAPATTGASKDGEKDARRADACIRFAETKGGAAGEAIITNTCAFPVEVTLCYKGGRGGPYDCPVRVRGRRADSLPPGVTHVLPDYLRATHKGIALVACRGTMGTVFPRLESDAGRSGCF